MFDRSDRALSSSRKSSHSRSGRPRLVPNISLLGCVAWLCAFATFTALAQKAPSAKPFERFDRCVLEPDGWTDGDSFRVRLSDGRLETFRLYFVDTTEARSRGRRSDQQAAYFGLTRHEAIELGQQAKLFTARALEKPFTIETRWRMVFTDGRHYAIVHTAASDDLAELLVKNGLARISGVRTPLADGRTSSQDYLAKLKDLEEHAKNDRLGGWRR